MRWGWLGGCLLVANSAWAACTGTSPNLTAASAQSTEIALCVSQAVDGDTINVPPGDVTWTTPLTINAATRSLTLRGAGVAQTIIRDAITGGATGLTITSAVGKAFRLTGIAFAASTAHNTSTPFIQINGGNTTAWRGDNLRFTGFQNGNRDTTIRVDNTFGVFHDIYKSGGFGFWLIAANSSYQGIGAYGDNSVVQPPGFGSANFIFIEDSTFENTGSLEQPAIEANGYAPRVVVRYCSFKQYWIGTHGTESAGRPRGGRAWEVYRNVFRSVSAFDQALLLRAGTGIFHHNHFKNEPGFTPNPAFSVMVSMRLVRADSQGNPLWGFGDGTGRWDTNDGVIYATGTHTGVSAQRVMTDSTKTWTSGQWGPGQNPGNPYSIRNVTRGWGSEIDGNSSNTITAQDNSQNDGPDPNQTWNTGDTYQILRAQFLIDQPGRGRGRLLPNQNPPDSSTYGDMLQVSEPVRVWSNTVAAGTIFSGAGSPPMNYTSSKILPGRDFIASVDASAALPGYTEYTYLCPTTGCATSGPNVCDRPTGCGHPLRTGGGVEPIPDPIPAPPTGFQIVP